MLRVAVRGLRARRLRSILMVATIMLGVSILGGSIVYGETAKAAFFDDLARAAAGVDVIAHPTEAHAAAAGPDGDAAALATLAALPGVTHVDRRAAAPLGLVGRSGRVITNAGALGLGLAAPTWPGFAPYHLDGRLPNAPGEAVIDTGTATREAIHLGDQVTVLDTDRDPHPLTVVGLASFGVSEVYADRSVVVLDRSDLLAFTHARDADIVISAPELDQAELSRQVAAVLGPEFTVATGAELREAIAVDSAKYVSSFLKTLRVTAIVALAVMLLVVYNAFQITVYQRAPEHALLRTLGARRGQIARLVAGEALVVGLVASAGSAVLSVGAGYALLWGQQVFGGGIPTFGLVVTPLAIAGPIAVGLVASVLSALLPAIAASRVSPLAAMQAATDPMPVARRHPLRLAFSLVLSLVVGAAGVYVLTSGRGQGFDGLPAMAAGGMVVFVALIMLLPLVLTTVSAPLRGVLGLIFGATGRIAVTNARRHPVRFAATTAALIIGIAPMTAFAILLTTAQTQGERELAENFPVDFAITHPAGTGAGGFDPNLIERLRARPELGVVAPSWIAAGDPTACCERLGTAEPGVLGGALAVEVRDGSLAELPPGAVAVNVVYAGAHDVRVGDQLTVGPVGQTWPATVVAIYETSPLQADALVNRADFVAAKFPADETLLIRRAVSSTAAAARAAVEAELATDPLAVVASSAERRETLADSLARRLIQFNVLLGLSMVIAVLGVANTLSLSVSERTRESAIMRALGLSRRQTYGSLLVEALLIALSGGLIGVAFGVGFGWLLAHELLGEYGHGAPDIPVTTIAIYVALGAVAGMLASVLPARRAARASITAAIDTL